MDVFKTKDHIYLVFEYCKGIKTAKTNKRVTWRT